ncbi:hypothetical protein J6590_073952 [Homalodisca vitripennis]|nr:hypothetical protein J6590_073952 [Homalodisca vitripennis]
MAGSRIWLHLEYCFVIRSPLQAYQKNELEGVQCHFLPLARACLEYRYVGVRLADVSNLSKLSYASFKVFCFLPVSAHQSVTVHISFTAATTDLQVVLDVGQL